MTTLPSKLNFYARTRDTGILPGRAQVIWRDWYTHAVVNQRDSFSTVGNGSNAAVVDLDALLGHIPVLIRSGAALLLHSPPAYTTPSRQAMPYALLASSGPRAPTNAPALTAPGELV